MVIDGTRPESLDQAIDIYDRAKITIGDIPIVAAINKADLTEQWRIDQESLDRLRQLNWPVIKSSAKLGTGVEDAFTELVRQMLSA